MLHPLSYLVFFAWILAVQLTGLAAFTKGFFLTRVELGLQSECDIKSLLSAEEIEHLSDIARRHHHRENTPHASSDTTLGDGCWLPPRFKRVVWVVVDALRYDFAAFSPSEQDGGEAEESTGRSRHSTGAKHYLNHLPVIQEAISGGHGARDAHGDDASRSVFHGSGGVLFQFEADPPTVTMQRLKGLTTGGLPTFIDFRDNFHSPEIAEDNWVAQVRARAGRRQEERRQRETKAKASHDERDAQNGGDDGRVTGEAGADSEGELVFMGDDTWTSLYPTYFSRRFPFPSFNTRDLHTVDNGVLSHLAVELAAKDWDVLVAHFLGVDHVGHTFGPASQAMEDKLDQMDGALRDVFKAVDDDTVVFVLGDHGMTEDGNHGGATLEETGAALLVWSRSVERLLGPTSSSLSPPPAALAADSPNGKKDHLRDSDRRAGFLDEKGGPKTETGDEGERIGIPASGRKVAQIDLVPTISLLLGTPIPFGNLGSIIPELFAGQYHVDSLAQESNSQSPGRRHALTVDEDAEAAVGPESYERLCDALLVNSVQVWRYLSSYAGVASMPEGDMFDLQRSLDDARDAHIAWHQRFGSHTKAASQRDQEARLVGLRQVCRAYRKFLDESIGLGRSLWTQYDTSLMWWGLALLLLATVVLALRAASSALGAHEAKRMLERKSAPFSSSGGSRGIKAGADFAGIMGGVAGVLGALLGDFVFGPSGPHVFASKVAICSCLGVCSHYVDVVWTMCGSRSYLVPRPIGTTASPGATSSGGGSAHSPGCRTAVVATALAALYCAGLFSNSFIEAEDGLHRFLGASSLLLLAVILLLLAPAHPPPPDSSSSNHSGRRVVHDPEGGSSNRDRGRFFVFLRSASSRAAMYTALAAPCLRAAAAAQQSAAENGVSAEATFGIVRSLLPLPVLWYLSWSAREGCGFLRSRGRDNIDKMDGSSTALELSRAYPASRKGCDPRGRRTGLEANSGGIYRRIHGVLQAASLIALGFYWVNEAIAGTSDGHDATPASASAANPVEGRVLGFFPAWRLLLPRVAYSLCLIGQVIALGLPLTTPKKQQASSPRAHDDTSEPHAGIDRGGKGFAEEVVATAAAVTSHLLPVILATLGPGSPAVVMFVTAACAFVVKGVSLAAGAGVAVPLGVVAVAWSVVGRSFFFLTGHHNQFSRLQYSAAFVGFDEFNFKIGGLLLFLNTFGTEILAAFALPLVAAAAAAAATANVANTTRITANATVAGSTPPHASPNAAPSSPDSVAFLTMMERLSGLVLLLSSTRTFLSAANVSLQRSHLMLWAIFAPKFVFDATMQAVCGAAAVASWAVVLVAHRACYRSSSVATAPLQKQQQQQQQQQQQRQPLWAWLMPLGAKESRAPWKREGQFYNDRDIGDDRDGREGGFAESRRAGGVPAAGTRRRR